jgi:hypothetical protein
VNQLLLPAPDAGGTAVQKGKTVQAQLSPLHYQLLWLLTTLGRRAAQRNNQLEPYPAMSQEDRNK